jgi:hypothetical protein
MIRGINGVLRIGKIFISARLKIYKAMMGLDGYAFLIQELMAMAMGDLFQFTIISMMSMEILVAMVGVAFWASVK